MDGTNNIYPMLTARQQMMLAKRMAEHPEWMDFGGVQPWLWWRDFEKDNAYEGLYADAQQFFMKERARIAPQCIL